MDATFGHYINYTGIPDESANADPCDPESLPTLEVKVILKYWSN